jgi:1-acyl-sn-glycerol-3-phosphate acyltransferase
MTPKHRIIRLADLVRSRKGGPVFRIILFIFGAALHLFFRRVETVNEEVVPEGTGVIFVLNHPNGLIDPALIFVALPRRISFLAKSTLFRMPVISFILRTVDALPVYRRIDAGEDIAQNLKTFEAARELLGRGGSIALFPEGVSHNSPKLMPVKTGAARIALGAVSVDDAADPMELSIVPVGLYYTRKTTFRSEALLHFGRPFAVEPAALDENGEPPREAVRALTDRIEAELRSVTLNAETEAELATAQAAHNIFVAGGEGADLHERLAFLQRYIAARSSEESEPGLVRIEERMKRFENKLGKLDIEAVHLSLARFSRAFVIRQALLQTWYLLVLSPIALIGAVLHLPAYQASKLLSHIYSRHGADDVASTVKVLAGIVFMPLTWIALAGVIYAYFGWGPALASIPASFVSGYAALITLEQLEEYRGWARGIWKFLRERDKFLRLLVESGDLRRDLQAFEEPENIAGGSGDI